MKARFVETAFRKETKFVMMGIIQTVLDARMIVQEQNKDMDVLMETPIPMQFATQDC